MKIMKLATPETHGYLPSLSWYSMRLPTEGWLDLGGWLVTYRYSLLYPTEDRHPSRH